MMFNGVLPFYIVIRTDKSRSYSDEVYGKLGLIRTMGFEAGSIPGGGGIFDQV